MTGEATRGHSRLRRRATGERLSGFIYGTIVVLAVIVGGDRAYPDDAGRIAAMVGVTSIVLWLAHVYAHAVERSVAHDEHLSVAELRRIYEEAKKESYGGIQGEGGVGGAQGRQDAGGAVREVRCSR